MGTATVSVPGAGRGSLFFFSSRRRHTRLQGDWSSDVCSSDLAKAQLVITGEGTFDKTSLVGKASGEVERRAQAAKTRGAVVAAQDKGAAGLPSRGGQGRVPLRPRKPAPAAAAVPQAFGLTAATP